FIEGAIAKPFGRTGDRTAAERAIEFHGRLIVGQGPDHDAFHAALREIAAGRGEQASAEAQALEFWAQIDLVDFTVVVQAAGAISAVVGIAGNLIAEHQDRDAATFADGAVPPVRAAAIDELFQFRAGNHALIGGAPGFVMGYGHRGRVGRRGAANLYQY